MPAVGARGAAHFLPAFGFVDGGELADGEGPPVKDPGGLGGSAGGHGVAEVFDGADGLVGVDIGAAAAFPGTAGDGVAEGRFEAPQALVRVEAGAGGGGVPRRP